jgi:hypothetical protein
MQTLLAAVAPLAAVLIGAALGYVSGRLLEKRKQLTLQKGQAYADYLRAHATAATGRKAEAQGQAADAKTRICIYGSAGVVGALSTFERAGANGIDEAGQRAIAQLVKAMCSDTGVAGAKLDDADFHLVLFGPERR